MTCFGTFLHQHFWTHLALEALAFLASLDQGCPILLFQPGVSEKSAAQTRICRAHTGRGTGCCFEGSDTYYLDSLPGWPSAGFCAILLGHPKTHQMDPNGILWTQIHRNTPRILLIVTVAWLCSCIQLATCLRAISAISELCRAKKSSCPVDTVTVLFPLILGSPPEQV